MRIQSNSMTVRQINSRTVYMYNSYNYQKGKVGAKNELIR